MKMLDGPSRAARSGRADSLVVLLHGYGANGDDLISLADALAPALPDCAFVSPNAPEDFPGLPGAYQWFPLSLRDPAEYARGAARAAPVLDAFLDAELAARELGHDRLVLLGFSQGTMMALHVGLRRAVAPLAIVGFSGVVAGADRLGAEIRAHPPTLLVHGAEDDVVPVEALSLTRDVLVANGVSVDAHVREGLGHGIDEAGLGLAGRFLSAKLSQGSTAGESARQGS